VRLALNNIKFNEIRIRSQIILKLRHPCSVHNDNTVASRTYNTDLLYSLPEVDGGLYEKRLITLCRRPVMEAVFWLNPDLVLYLV
jgi:hypothetical protein